MNFQIRININSISKTIFTKQYQPHCKMYNFKIKLKTIIVTVILAGGISSSTQCHAQAALFVLIFGDKVATEKFHLTIDAGLNLSDLPGLSQSKISNGVTFGLGTFIKLNDKWALAPEFKPLSPRGAKDVKLLVPLDVDIQDTKTNFTTNWIDVPILVRYNISKSFFAAVGPQISFLMSAEQITSGTTSSSQDVVVTQDIEPQMNKQDFMIPIELGYSLSQKRGGKGLNIKARYNIGLTEVFTNTSSVSSNNSTIQFILSFPFINIPENGK